MTLATVEDLLNPPPQTVFDYCSDTFVNSQYSASMWLGAGGATPPSGAGAATDSSTVGGFSRPNIVSGQKLYLVELEARRSSTTEANGRFMYFDRLVATSGLVATSVAAQTINSAALTRYTDAIGVWAAFELYTTAGSGYNNITGLSYSYTNQAGVSGHTATLVMDGAEFLPFSSSMIVLPLQDGDLGVQSVQTMTLNGTAAISAGNFGVTLLKPIAFHSHYLSSEFNARATDGWMELGLPEIHIEACLAGMHLNPSGAAFIHFLTQRFLIR